MKRASHAAIHEDLIPELKAGHPFRALGLSLLELLTAGRKPAHRTVAAPRSSSSGGRNRIIPEHAARIAWDLEAGSPLC